VINTISISFWYFWYFWKNILSPLTVELVSFTVIRLSSLTKKSCLSVCRSLLHGTYIFHQK
jgi:hypothetical protein